MTANGHARRDQRGPLLETREGNMTETPAPNYDPADEVREII
jgi:hypothetical protein